MLIRRFKEMILKDNFGRIQVLQRIVPVFYGQLWIQKCRQGHSIFVYGNSPRQEVGHNIVL